GDRAAQPRLTQPDVGDRSGALQRVLVVGAVAVAVAALAGSGAPVCPSAGWLGVPCPGCGLTRASLLLVSGDVAAALRLHPLVLVAAPAALWLVGDLLVGWVVGRSPAPAGGKRSLASRVGTWSAGG